MPSRQHVMSRLIAIGGLSRVLQAQPVPSLREELVRLRSADGVELEGKLTLPSDGVRPPVVFFLHGAGARTYDHQIRYRARNGEILQTRYYDYFARELAARGVALFRMNKRGVTVDSTGGTVIERAKFSMATPTVLLGDYSAGLNALRMRADIDPDRIVLYGQSEGTRLAARLVGTSPTGIRGLVLTSYSGDNTHDTVVWQNTIGPWRNVASMIPSASAGELPMAAYEAAAAANPVLRRVLPFGALDRNGDGVLTTDELQQVTRPRLDAVLRAVADRDDEYLWENFLNLTSAYLLDDWESPRTWEYLFRTRVPIRIFHGALDAVTRVEAVEEVERVYRAAGRAELEVRVYPGFGHDLGWTPEAALGPGPMPLRESLDAAAALARGALRR